MTNLCDLSKEELALLIQVDKAFTIMTDALVLIRDSTYRDAVTLRGIADQALQRAKEVV